MPGEFNYAHSTALGKCLLSERSEEEVEGIIAQHGLQKLARNTITSGSVLLQELRKVRAEGVAVNHEENIDGVICVAAPIRDKDGVVIAALSVSGPAIRMELILDVVKHEVRQVAARVSGMLGYTGATTSDYDPLVASGHPPMPPLGAAEATSSKGAFSVSRR